MYRLLLVFSLSAIYFTVTTSQPVPVPLNIQQAVNARTRTNIGVPGDKYFQNHSDYKINANFNPKTGKLTGRANITYFNNSPDTLHKIVLRLYQNIFRPGAARDEEIEYTNLGEGVTINDLYVNGKSLVNEMNLYTRTEGTNFNIYLPEDLKPSDSCQLNIAWYFTMPQKSVHRFGKYSEATFFVALWYPQVSVYDDIEGWDELQYNGTQEFYNDFNNYDVTITISGNNMLWATGNWVNADDILSKVILNRLRNSEESRAVVHIIEQENIENQEIFSHGKKSYHYVARNVPDFVFATSDHYLWDAASVIIDSANKKRVFVSAVYPKESYDFKNVVEIGTEVIQRLSRESYEVPYPYEAVTVFNGDGGMEYPMMINNRSSRNYNSCVFLTLHEIAHGYFPFMTGINERKYSWMDEGLTSFLPMETQDSLKSDANSMVYFISRYETFCGTESDIPLSIPAYQIRGNSYVYFSYYRPAIAFNMLENIMGRDTFRLAIKNFIETWKDKHPVPHDFFSILKKSTNIDIDWLVYQWFYSCGYPDLTIADVSINQEFVKVYVKKTGNFAVPVKLTFTYENGERETVVRNIAVWKDQNSLYINQPVKPGLKTIELGSNEIPDVNRKDNNYILSQ